MTSRRVPLFSLPTTRWARWRRLTRHFTTTGASFGVVAAVVLGPCTPPPDPSGIQLQAKPVQAPCTYRDTFGDPRSGGRTHEGVDIMADEGNELYAVVDGEISKIYDNYSLAGNGLRIALPDGTYFFYAHLLRRAPGIEVGTDVVAGQLVGYVGETGNAGTPHLHLEIHPQGGAAINPYPIVNQIGAC